LIFPALNERYRDWLPIVKVSLFFGKRRITVRKAKPTSIHSIALVKTSQTLKPQTNAEDGAMPLY
jgi:hypothetical protein